jgi:hypothetical protein
VKKTPTFELSFLDAPAAITLAGRRAFLGATKKGIRLPNNPSHASRLKEVCEGVNKIRGFITMKGSRLFRCGSGGFL